MSLPWWALPHQLANTTQVHLVVMQLHPAQANVVQHLLLCGIGYRFPVIAEAGLPTRYSPVRSSHPLGASTKLQRSTCVILARHKRV